MTRNARDVPKLWHELAQAEDDYAAAAAELEAAATRCRVLIVALLKAGVPASTLEGHPWSRRTVQKIVAEEGLGRRKHGL